MYWMKCGKIIKRNSELVKADECPCGYWGLFVLTYYSKGHKKEDSAEFTVDDFCSRSLQTFAYNVTYNTINLSGFIYAPSKLCVPISRAADAAGKVGELDIDIEDPSSCAEYNEDSTECIKKYYIRYKIKIYRIGTFYDDYSKFCQFFWEPCGIAPDKENHYPDPIDNGSSCIDAHWHPEAEKLYRPTCTIKYDVMEWGFNMWYPMEQCVTALYCYTYCKGNCRNHDYDNCADNSDCCTDCEGETVEVCDLYCDHAISIAILINKTNDKLESYYPIGGEASWKEDCGNGSGCWQFKYPDCETFWSGTENALTDINDYEKKRGKRENYTVKNTDISKESSIPGSWNNMCVSYNHEAYHGSHLLFRQYWKLFQCADLKVERGADTPSAATGIKIYASAYSYKTEEEYAVIKNRTDWFWHNEEITLKFGEVIQLPICDNMTEYFINNQKVCPEDEQAGNRPDIYPQGWHNTTESFNISFAVIEYVY